MWWEESLNLLAMWQWSLTPTSLSEYLVFSSFSKMAFIFFFFFTASSFLRSLFHNFFTILKFLKHFTNKFVNSVFPTMFLFKLLNLSSIHTAFIQTTSNMFIRVRFIRIIYNPLNSFQEKHKTSINHKRCFQ